MKRKFISLAVLFTMVFSIGLATTQEVNAASLDYEWLGPKLYLYSKKEALDFADSLESSKVFRH